MRNKPVPKGLILEDPTCEGQRALQLIELQEASGHWGRGLLNGGFRSYG